MTNPQWLRVSLIIASLTLCRASIHPDVDSEAVPPPKNARISFQTGITASIVWEAPEDDSEEWTYVVLQTEWTTDNNDERGVVRTYPCDTPSALVFVPPSIGFFRFEVRTVSGAGDYSTPDASPVLTYATVPPVRIVAENSSSVARVDVPTTYLAQQFSISVSVLTDVASSTVVDQWSVKMALPYRFPVATGRWYRLTVLATYYPSPDLVFSSPAFTTIYTSTSPGGGVVGDPHITSWDGGSFTVRPSGDFVLVHSASTGLALHARFHSLRTQYPATWAEAVAVRCGHGEASVEVHAASNSPIFSPASRPKHLPAPRVERYMSRGRDTIRIRCDHEGLRVFVHIEQLPVPHYDVSVAMLHRTPTNDWTGLLGTPNGDHTDDVRQRDGRVLEHSVRFMAGAPSARIDALARTWRTLHAERLFSVAFPHDVPGDAVVKLDSATARVLRHARAEGRKVCAAARVRQPYLAMCAFDYAQQRDPSIVTKYRRFASSAP